MKRFILALLVAGAATSAFALPTVAEIESEVAKGNYLQAESQMREVVAAKPNSARAHYIYAEILAHDKRFDQAASEVAAARRIDPDLQFTDPARFKAFERLLEREQAAAQRPVVTAAPLTASTRPTVPMAQETPAVSGGVPVWVWGLGAAALAWFAWRKLSANRQSQVYPASAGMPVSAAPGYGPGAGTGPGAGYGPAYSPGVAPGSGLLTTGLAVAGGVAAGMLAEKLLDGRHDSGSLGAGPGASPNLIPNTRDDSVVDDSAQRELEQRPVDFGNGGNDWGGSDPGSSSSDDGGW